MTIGFLHRPYILKFNNALVLIYGMVVEGVLEEEGGWNRSCPEVETQRQSCLICRLWKVHSSLEIGSIFVVR